MSQTIRSVFIIAVIGAAGVILVAMTNPYALWNTILVAGFAVGVVCIAAAIFEAILLYDRLAGTFTRFRAKLEKTGDAT